MQRREFIPAAFGGIAAVALPARTQAPAGPDKPVKWILSQPPGSGPDRFVDAVRSGGFVQAALVRTRIPGLAVAAGTQR